MCRIQRTNVNCEEEKVLSNLTGIIEAFFRRSEKDLFLKVVHVFDPLERPLRTPFI